MSKASANMKRLQEMLMQQLGKDPAHYVEEPFNDNERGMDERKFTAEATLRNLQWPHSPKELRTCKGCGNNFFTEYHSVAYCSTLCRKSELKRYGIDYSDKPLKHSYGGMTPPGIIPPDALESMALVLKQAGYTVLNPHEVIVALPEDSPTIEPDQIQTKNEIQDVLEITQRQEDFDELDPFLL